MSRFGEMPTGGRKRARAKRAKNRKEYKQWLHDYEAWVEAKEKYEGKILLEEPVIEEDLAEAIHNAIWEPQEKDVFDKLEDSYNELMETFDEVINEVSEETPTYIILKEEMVHNTGKKFCTKCRHYFPVAEFDIESKMCLGCKGEEDV